MKDKDELNAMRHSLQLNGQVLPKYDAVDARTKY